VTAEKITLLVIMLMLKIVGECKFNVNFVPSLVAKPMKTLFYTHAVHAQSF